MNQETNNRKDDMKLLLLKQPYLITMARHDFNVHESRVFLKVIECLQPRMIHDKAPHEISEDDLGNLEVKIPVKEIIKSSNYDEIRTALKKLTKKEIVVEERDENGNIVSELFTNLLMAGGLKHRTSFCELLIHKKVVPHLIGLNNNYTRFSAKPAFDCSSPNTMKLYLMCSHFRDIKQIDVRLESFKNWLRIEKKYSRIFDIRKRVIDPAIKELKKKADVWFEISKNIKEGRKVVGWKFNIYNKDKVSKKLPASEISNFEAIEKRMIDSFHLSAKQAKKVAKSVEKQALNKTLHAIQLQKINGKIQNLGGYTRKVLNEKFNLNI